MANNTNSPFGFREYRSNGSAPTYEQFEFPIDYNASNIFYGDPVTPQSDGTMAQSASTGSSPAALGTGGVFVGCSYLSIAFKRRVWSNYWPANSDVASGNYISGYVINSPNAQFIAQSDSTGIAYPGGIGSTVGFVIGTGTTANGISGAYLDSTTLNNSVNNPFKIVQVYQPTTAGFPGAYANSQAYDWAIVMFNAVFTRNLQGT